ncbi:Holliday junction resolvase [Mycolicibacter engbaekii]|uniref:Putative pre-16S rRNA nuclease n=1 Tax=Mycolicibacter engbaekii TaxID=188915 RepID=A0A1X1TZ89_9MYCO|nr:Holliday junction resolvase RuvX [Mycolicibacter engbaekii]ORV49886.1 Holliday junction resolvase [Mycolicibacter engbaekii]
MTSPHHRSPDRPGGPDDPGRGRRLGVDVGSVRIGVSCCDPDGLLATPVETVRRHSSGSHLRRLADLADEYDVVEVVVGLPRTLADRAGSAAQDALSVADGLARVLAQRGRRAPVRLADERLSTVSAARDLHAAGVRSKRQRSVIDQAAAVTILQSWLDQRRAMTGSALPTEDDDV